MGMMGVMGRMETMEIQVEFSKKGHFPMQKHSSWSAKA